MISTLELRRKTLAYHGYRDGGGDAPDNSGVNQAALEQARLSREALDWYKAEYAATAGDRADATRRANEVSDAQLAQMRFATIEAQRQAERNRTLFEPLQNDLVADAASYDTAGRRIQAADEARTNVEQAFGGAQDATARAIRRTGGNVGGGRAGALMQDFAIEKAKATTGATAGAVRTVEQQGHARKMDAAGLGMGVAGNQATMHGIASQAGGGAAGASGQALGASMSGLSGMGQGFGQAMQGNAQAGSLFGQATAANQAHQNAKAQQQSSTMSALGTTAMAAALFFSDEDLKSNTDEPIDTKEALAGIVATPVKKGWRYDKAKGGPDDGGVPHDGPMAQEVRAHMGEKAAPGGKVIDVVTINGRLMAGMQELVKRMERVEQRVAR